MCATPNFVVRHPKITNFQSGFSKHPHWKGAVTSFGGIRPPKVAFGTLLDPSETLLGPSESPIGGVSPVWDPFGTLLDPPLGGLWTPRPPKIGGPKQVRNPQKWGTPDFQTPPGIGIGAVLDRLYQENGVPPNVFEGVF